MIFRLCFWLFWFFYLIFYWLFYFFFNLLFRFICFTCRFTLNLLFLLLYLLFISFSLLILNFILFFDSLFHFSGCRFLLKIGNYFRYTIIIYYLLWSHCLRCIFLLHDSSLFANNWLFHWYCLLIYFTGLFFNGFSLFALLIGILNYGSNCWGW